MDATRITAVLRAFTDTGVEYKLVGAIAMAVQGIIRSTQDLDLFIRPTEENVSRVRQALASLWEDRAIEEIRAEDLGGEYPTIRYGPPGEEFCIDLMSRPAEAFDFEAIDSEIVEFEGIRLRVATPGMLRRMKLATRRLQDHADAEALREKFGLGDA